MLEFEGGMTNFKFFRGKVVMPLRIAKPWLLLDWVYKLTETASTELNQKRKLDEFTKKVNIPYLPSPVQICITCKIKCYGHV